MEKIFITTQTGQKVEVGVVRLFKHNESVFFIYTLSEKDANNYVKLYVTKINMSNLQSVVISDENEWTSFKDIMKDIIKRNRDNTPLEIVDLDPKTIENITVYDPKVFKLSEEMTNFLQMNVKLANAISEVSPVEPQSVVPDVFAPVEPTTQPVEQPVVSNTVVDISSLSGDISASPELAVDNAVPNQDIVSETAPLTEEVNANNQMVQEQVTMESQGIVENVNNSQEEIIDYKVAYLEEKVKVETLNTKISTLEAEIKLLEQKLEQVKNIVQ